LESSKRLKEVREQIAEKTRVIIEAFCQRALLANEIASLKKQLNLPIEDYLVEKNLAEQVRSICVRYGLDPSKGLKLLNFLISESISLQKSLQTPLITPKTVFEETRRLEEQGSKVIHLEVGEPDFGPPQRVVDAAIRALKEGRTHYTSQYGIAELRRALADKMSERWKASIRSNEILVTPGGRAALVLALSSTLTPGDSAIIIEPAWPAYRKCVESLGCRARVLHTRFEDEWEPDVSKIEDLIDETTKAIIINSPCNPTGKIFAKKTMNSIIDVATKHNLTILSDEAYAEFSYTDRYSLLPEDCTKIVIGTFSKGWGMTGFRLGYLITSSEKCDVMAELAGDLYTSVPEPIQIAGLAALDCFDEVDVYVALMKERCRLITSLLKSLPVEFKEPDGAFYVFFKLSRGENAQEFVEQLLREKLVALTPGSGFGDYPQFVRLSFCRPEEELREGVARMRELLL